LLEAVAVMAAARVLYVVSRERADLYASLRDAFMESPRLAIVLDRRAPAETTAEPERRQVMVDESLRTRGWARVRIEPDGRAVISDAELSSEDRSSPSY
jgi:hypothetical protein